MACDPSLLNITVDLDNFEEDSLKVLCHIRPRWDPGNIIFKYFTDGITNKLVGIFHKSDPSDVVLIRINGENTELIIDRNAEVETFHLLSAFNCSPPLYARFSNGIAYGYFHGRPLDENLVRDDRVATLIARELVRLHTIRPDKKAPELYKSKYPSKAQAYLDIFPTSFDDPQKQEAFLLGIPSKFELQRELDEITQQLRELHMPVVFCHNDLLLKNIIYDEEKGEVHFIDYEYAFLNYQAYDIGNHFCEYAGVDEVNFDLYPDREYQLRWLRRYLEFYFEALGQDVSKLTDPDVERLYVQVNKCAAASHFFWGIWALIQAKNSTIDFDFVEYSRLRLREYFRRKNEFFSLSLP